MEETLVAVAGGSGFIGRAIIRRLAAMPGFRVRALSRDPARARNRIGDDSGRVEFVTAEVTEPTTLVAALADVHAVVNAVQFDGYPIENPRRGLTFERIDLGGTLNLIEAAKETGVRQFVYISGAA